MKRLITSFLIIGLPILSQAQFDPYYKLYQFNQMMINPAYTGIYNRFTASFTSSMQWVGLEGAPVTNTLTVQSAIKRGQMGVGAMLINDKIGINNNNEAIVCGSYNLDLGEAKLGMGLQGGVVNYGYDPSLLELDHQDDPRLQGAFVNVTEPNFGAGLMLMNVNYFVGLSVPRILDVVEKDGGIVVTKYKKHFYLSGGYHFDTFASGSYKFTTLIRFVEDSDPSIDLSASSNVDGLIWFGLSARDLRHFGVFTFFNMGDRYRLGYAFELPTNSIVRDSYGTHQISLAFDANFGRRQVMSNRNF